MSSDDLLEDLYLPPGLRARTFQKFFKKLAHGGFLLIFGAVAGIVWANLSAAHYAHFWHNKRAIQADQFKIFMSLAHWVNDVLMTLFFFSVGLEIKREFLVSGLLKKRSYFTRQCNNRWHACPCTDLYSLQYRHLDYAKRGIVCGSLINAFFGYYILKGLDDGLPE